MNETLVLLLAGTFLLSLLVALLACDVWKRLRWTRASAVVVRYVIRRGDEGRYFAPVVRFQAQDGTQVVAIVSHGSWRRPWRRGDAVSIRYSPVQPCHCDLVCFSVVWGPILTVVALLTMLALVAFY